MLGANGVPRAAAAATEDLTGRSNCAQGMMRDLSSKRTSAGAPPSRATHVER